MTNYTESIYLTISTTTDDELTNIITKIEEVIPNKYIKYIELPFNNYTYIYIKESGYFDILVELLDKIMIEYPKIRYKLEFYKEKSVYPYRIRINTKGKKIITKEAKKAL